MSDNASAPSVVESSRARAPLTDRTNQEPSIINGMTMTEAQVISAVSLVLLLVLSAVLGTATGLWGIVVVLPILGTGLILWYSSKYLQGLKRGRPDGYYTQAIHLWLAERGLVKPKFIRHDGWWSLGRTLPMSYDNPLVPRTQATVPTAAVDDKPGQGAGLASQDGPPHIPSEIAQS